VLVSLFAAASAGSLQTYGLPSRSGLSHSLGASRVSSGVGFSGSLVSGGVGLSGGLVSRGVGLSSGSGFSGGAGFAGGAGFSRGAGFTGGVGVSGGAGLIGGACGNGQIRHVDGSCVTPQITRNLYVYSAPPLAPIVGPPPIVPPPKIEQNVLFIRSPDVDIAQDPIIVPPPQTKNVVYVLNKRPELDQKVVHLPALEQQTPEVFFVNYAEGDNPTLPTGEDLQSALSSAAHGGIGIGSGIGIGGGSVKHSGFSVTTPSSLYGAP
ncbi:hypothetical protein OTU49_015155, partial [Cherax quadricarinatus]